MNLLTLSCNECGAPLEVPEGTRFVTCSFCSARLAVQHSGGAVYTEVLAKLGKQTEQLAQDVEILKLQNRLEQFDREWAQEREQYMVQGKHGRHFPDAARSVVGGIGAVIIGMVFVGVAFSVRSPIPALMGLVAVGFGLFSAISGVSKADAYATALKRHERGRDELLRHIRDRESAAEEPDGPRWDAE